MRKILLLFSAVVLTLPCFAHHEMMEIKHNITASKTNTSNNGTAYWVIPARNQQFFGTRYGNTKNYEAGMFKLGEGIEYAAIWSKDNTADKSLAEKDFSNLLLDKIKLTVTTGSNFTGITKKGQKGGATIVADYTPNPHVTLTMYIYSIPQEDGSVYTATCDFGVVHDDVRKAIEYEVKDIKIDTPDGNMFPKIDYIKVLFGNVVEGQDWVALRNTDFRCEKQHVPILSLNHQVTGFNPGEVRIQAEDFDGPHADGSPAHSNTAPAGGYADGYGYDARKFDPTCQNIRIHINSESPEGSKGFNLWTPGHGSTDQGLGFALVNFAQQEWNAAYKESVEEASLEELADYYGAWAEYTIDVQDELIYADISLRTGVHNANFQAYKAGSAPSPVVAGEGENYMAKYGAAYRIFVDGEPVRSNWIVRPSSDIHTIPDFATWLDNMDEEPVLRAVAEPSYFVYAVPDVSYAYGDKTNCGNTWSAVYKSEIGDHLQSVGAITDGQKQVYDTPDFANIELSKGSHVIKVQAMGGRTSFDEIKVQAHSNPDTPTGIDLVQQLPGENSDANAPVEWYTLQGVRVENPSNGIFIRRQGSRAAKVALK